jgi:2,4-dienoyl-CoA reductase (NADPH2)
VSCLVNPRAGFEREFPTPEAPSTPDASTHMSDKRERDGGGRGARRFAVIGGGPAGMEAARSLASLGAQVQLYEAGTELGGQFRLARLVPGKEDYEATIAYFEAELERLGVVVHLGHELSDDDAGPLADMDGVVLATGVLPRPVEIPGAELGHVVDYVAAFEGELDGAERVAIVGAGGIGVDLAHRLTHVQAGEPYEAFYGSFAIAPPRPPGSAGSIPGAVRKPRYTRLRNRAGEAEEAGGDPKAPRVTLMRRSGRVGSGIGKTTRWVWLDALKRAGVETRTGLAYRAITPDGVEIETENGIETIAADRVVIAAGQERNDRLRPLLERLEIPHRVVGGAENPSELNAVRAFADGLRAAYDLAG